jgi:hypothetical protein
MLLVEHTRCAEHGELVHEGERHHHDAVADSSEDGAAVESGGKEPASSTHEHCALTADRRDAVVSTAESPLYGALAIVSDEQAFEQRFVHVDVARFRVAPKNSPPA